MSKSKWYDQGSIDAHDGFFDPPWQPGHRDYERYVEGHRDAQAEMERQALNEIEPDRCGADEEMIRVGPDGKLVPKRWRE